jgi:hypothetical protein
MEFARATDRVTRKLKAGFIGVPEDLSGELQERYGSKHEAAVAKFNGKESSN